MRVQGHWTSSVLITLRTRSRLVSYGHGQVVHHDSHHVPPEAPTHRHDDQGTENEEQSHEFEDEAGVDGEGVEVHSREQRRDERADIHNDGGRKGESTARLVKLVG